MEVFEWDDLKEAKPSPVPYIGLLLASAAPFYRFSPRLSLPTVNFVIPIGSPELPFSISFSLLRTAC